MTTNPSRLFSYLQTSEAEFAIPVLLEVVARRVDDYRMTHAPTRQISPCAPLYWHPPNQGFGAYDLSFGDGWRARMRGLWTELEVKMGDETVSACFAPSGERVLVSDLGDAMREAREQAGELYPRLSSWTGFRERIPIKPKHRAVCWDRLGRDGDDFDDSERPGGTREHPLWIDYEEGGILVACRYPINNDCLPTWADLQPAICALMLARLRVRTQWQKLVAEGKSIADALASSLDEAR